MRRKRLNHYADVIRKMFAGRCMGNDLEILSEIPDGIITIDLLAGKDSHSIVGELNLSVSKEVTAWLSHQSAKEGIDWAKMDSATLEVAMDTGKVATNREKIVMFNFECKAKLCTADACYETAFLETAKWHTRISTWKKIEA
ncbi:MAG: hypothetical protein V4660_03735 [Pseudomonadota bacterium]